MFSENGINSYLRFSGFQYVAFSDYVQIEGGVRLSDQTESFMVSMVLTVSRIEMKPVVFMVLNLAGLMSSERDMQQRFGKFF